MIGKVLFTKLPSFLQEKVTKGSPSRKPIHRLRLLNQKQRKVQEKELTQWLYPQALEKLKNGAPVVLSEKENGYRIAMVSPAAPEKEFWPKPSIFAFWQTQGAWLAQWMKQEGPVFIEEVHIDQEELKAFLVGLELGWYTFLNHYGAQKQTGKDSASAQLLFYELPPKNLLHEAWAWGYGMNLARHLVNFPASEATPINIAYTVKKLLSTCPDVRINILEKKALQREKMGLILGVGNGSNNPPCLVELIFEPKNLASDEDVIALVGKGVTFDSGGLDIKPSSAMRLMKKDMAGAAAVFATIFYAAQNKLPMRIKGYLPLAENAVGPFSMHPGDILIARSGLRVEIHNTDAEGRLLLADAMDYALSRNPKPSVLIDLATLTGAIKTTLGLEIAGLFSNNRNLSREIQTAGEYVGDLAWPVPLYQPYKKALKQTSFGDLINCTDGWGTPITAALFLENFVKETSWAHLDIYGWTDKPQGPFTEAGANAQGVSLLIQWLKLQKLNQK